MLDQGSMLIDAAHCQPKFEERAAKAQSPFLV